MIGAFLKLYFNITYPRLADNGAQAELRPTVADRELKPVTRPHIILIASCKSPQALAARLGGLIINADVIQVAAIRQKLPRCHYGKISSTISPARSALTAATTRATWKLIFGQLVVGSTRIASLCPV